MYDSYNQVQYTKDFWSSILEDETFKTFVANKYSVASGAIMQDEDE
jgi:hypothetical protein